MEEKENYGFCPACGANLPENSSFCPECGHSINAAGGGSEQPGYSGAGYGYSRSPQTYLVGKLKVAFIFVIIYAVMSILGSFYLLMINDAMLDQMETALEGSGMTLDDILEAAGMDSRSEFLDMCHITGAVSLISGILCVVACVFIYKHNKRMIATILIAVAALINFALVTYNGILSTLFNVVVGCIMAYLVYDSKEAFTDEQ